MASVAYLAGFDAGFAGRSESCNPYSVADVSNFNDWDIGHLDGCYDAECDADSDNDVDEWDYDDSMDGDFDSAMESAGYGYDEQYDHYDEY